MPKSVELSQALNAKLIHDLAGSIGAIDNCVGLLDNDNKIIGQKARILLDQEVKNLSGRIRFFRSAYSTSYEEDEMSLISVKKILTDFFKETGVAFKLSFEEGVLYVESHIARALICLSSIISENIAPESSIDLRIPKNKENPITLKKIGCKKVLCEKKTNILEGDVKSPIDVFNCREHYISRLCTKSDSSISINKNPRDVEYIISKNNFT
ncbi:hypothetical protein OAP56_01080 [Rickettsiaceae bacterium]|nr:hypothetical protein [Rickettsiaceae bacterium]